MRGMALESNGLISVYVGSALVGQGVETVMTQISADALGVGMDSIRILSRMTIYLHEGFGASHSRSTVMGGSAICPGAEDLKKAIRKAAACD